MPCVPFSTCRRVCKCGCGYLGTALPLRCTLLIEIQLQTPGALRFVLMPRTVLAHSNCVLVDTPVHHIASWYTGTVLYIDTPARTLEGTSCFHSGGYSKVYLGKGRITF